MEEGPRPSAREKRHTDARAAESALGDVRKIGPDAVAFARVDENMRWGCAWSDGDQSMVLFEFLSAAAQ